MGYKWLSLQIFSPDLVTSSITMQSLAKRMLGYDPQYDFARGLNEAIEWYKANL